jgi:hypothetical protein
MTLSLQGKIAVWSLDFGKRPYITECPFAPLLAFERGPVKGSDAQGRRTSTT